MREATMPWPDKGKDQEGESGSPTGELSLSLVFKEPGLQKMWKRVGPFPPSSSKIP